MNYSQKPCEALKLVYLTSFSNNLCEKIILSLESPTIFDKDLVS